MPSFLYTRTQLTECEEKTIRWPGHWEDAIEGKIYENFLEELKRRKINILEVSKKI
jgi:hypothetical protein